MEIFDLGERDLVVSIDLHILTQFSEILDEIVGERIVVIDNQQHGEIQSLAFNAQHSFSFGLSIVQTFSKSPPDGRSYSNPCSASSIAFIMARDLLHVSSYSCSGFESATMPAPAWMKARRRVTTTVRILM